MGDREGWSQLRALLYESESAVVLSDDQARWSSRNEMVFACHTRCEARLIPIVQQSRGALLSTTEQYNTWRSLTNMQRDAT